MESTVAISWAFSKKVEPTYGVALNPTSQIDQSHPMLGADIADHVPAFSDNAAFYGKGHEFATRNELLSWDVKFRRQFHATSSMLAWAFAFHTGRIVATTPLAGAPSGYSHSMIFNDVMTGTSYGGVSRRQQPSTTIVERVTSGLARIFPGCVVQAVEVTGQIGQWLQLSLDMVGSGKKTDGTGFSFPTATEGSLLKHASLTFMTGPSGATNISADVRSFRFRSEMQLADQEGYYPGSGYNVSGDPTSGQVRGKLEFTRRAVLFEAVVTATSSTQYHGWLEGNSLQAATLTIDGASINAGYKHQLKIELPQLKYRAVPIQTDGDLITYSIQTVVFYDSGITAPYRVTVQTDQTSYLVTGT